MTMQVNGAGGYASRVTVRDVLALVGIVLLISGGIVAIGVSEAHQTVFDCPAARAGALAIVRDYPQVTVPYTGGQEDQCQLNDVVKEFRR